MQEREKREENITHVCLWVVTGERTAHHTYVVETEKKTFTYVRGHMIKKNSRASSNKLGHALFVHC